MSQTIPAQPLCPTCGNPLHEMAGSGIKAWYCYTCSATAIQKLVNGAAISSIGYSVAAQPIPWYEQQPFPACTNCGYPDTSPDLDEYSERPYPKFICNRCGHIWEVK